MVVDNSIYISHRHDGQDRIRRTNLATDCIHAVAYRWFHIYYMDSGANLSGWDTDAWREDKLQGDGKMVYDERLIVIFQINLHSSEGMTPNYRFCKDTDASLPF